jgi:hypothetical protein
MILKIMESIIKKFLYLNFRKLCEIIIWKNSYFWILENFGENYLLKKSYFLDLEAMKNLIEKLGSNL